MAPRLSEENKELIGRCLEIGQVVFRYGLVPSIILLGWLQTSPRINLFRLISPVPIGMAPV
ncbi:Tom7-domain-containing protein [Lipomyces arxii]|uniref:Tom7-domain-containing protein n=1 Tax=Lipomyces arxii TaxID=56418 RepID=UPI0034CD3AF1